MTKKSKVKRKIISICLIASLGSAAILGGTLAYYTDEEKATNAFTSGNVSVQQVEHQRAKDKANPNAYDANIKDVMAAIINSPATEPFTQNQTVAPAIHSKLIPKETIKVCNSEFGIRNNAGNYVDKIVNVYNDGKSEAYVRTIIAVPNFGSLDDSNDATNNPLHWNFLDHSDFAGTGWDWDGDKNTDGIEGSGSLEDPTHKISNVTIDGKSYDLYVATYNKALAPESWTSPSMVGFYLDNDVGHDDNGYFITLNGSRVDLDDYMSVDAEGKVQLDFLVATQACQTNGFDDAWEALDECFGEITATNNPWISGT